MTHTKTPEAPSSSLLGDVLRGWDRFWFSSADPTTLGFIRICAGLLVFYVLLCYSWDLLSYVGPEGWMNAAVAQYVVREAPQYTLGLGWTDQPQTIAQGNYFWSVYYHITDPGWIIATHVFFLLSVLAFTVGLWTRFTSVITWVAAISYTYRSTTTVFGLDTMMMIVLLYLMIGPSGAALSLDRWLLRRRGRRLGEPVPDLAPTVLANFTTRLFQVHFCVIYLAAGTSKLLGPSWWTGTALNQVMLNASFAPMDYGPYFHLVKWLAGHRLLWEVSMSASIAFTLLMEIGLPFLIWVPRLRWVMVCGSVFLHTGIAVFMGLGTFSLMMLIMLCSFIPPEVIRGLVARLEEALGRLGSFRHAAKAQPADLVLTR